MTGNLDFFLKNFSSSILVYKDSEYYRAKGYLMDYADCIHQY